MRKTFSFVAVSGLLAFGCIVNSSDDDGTTTTTGPNTSTAADGVDDGGSTSNASNATTDNSSSGGPPGTTSTAGDTTAGDGGTATDTGAPAGTCGWGKTGDPMFPEGYICGGSGEDPAAMFPYACPDGAELVEGGACGDVRAQGCCDVNGDLWFCAEDGMGGTGLMTEDCPAA